MSSLDPLRLDLRGARLIEASAGTGKTYSLAFLYLRLILAHGQVARSDLGVDNILVLTFTKAATQELRHRIRQRLAEAAQVFFAPQDCQDPLLQQLLDDYPEPTARLAAGNKLLLAAENMDRAAILTIHGWCFRMLQQHAFACGLAFGLQLCEQEQKLLQQLVWDYWRQFYLPLTSEPLADVLAICPDPNAMQKMVTPLLPAAPLLSACAAPADFFATHAADKQQWAQQSKQQWAQQDWLTELRVLFENGIKAKRYSGRKLNTAMRTKVYQLLQDWLDQEQALPDPALFQGKGFAHMSDPWLSLEANFDAQTGECCRALQRLQQECQHWQDIRQPLMEHALAWLQERFSQAKLSKGWVSQQDLLQLLQQALANDSSGRLRAQIIQELPVALVDEFQDTDPCQYEIFRTLYQPERAPQDLLLLMIGDPKQAIYSFRGADLDTYLRAKQDLQQPADILGTNYRSSPEVVEGVNQWFDRDQRLLPQGSFCVANDQQPALPFLPASGQSAQGQLVLRDRPWAANQWLWQEQTTTKGEYQQWAAQQCAWQIAELLHASQQGQCHWQLPKQGKQPLLAADIAVLVNHRGEAQLVRAQLQQLGIASVYLSDRSNVYQGWVATELLAILRALCHPTQERLLRTALATRLLCPSVNQLQAWLGDPLHWQQLQQRMQQLHQRWQQQGLLPALYALLQYFSVPGRLLAELGGERHLTDLLHLAELLQQASMEHASPEALLQYCEERLLDEDNQEHEQQRLESDQGLVKLITIHKSKGLQYPLVMLPFGLNPIRDPQKSPAPYLDQSGVVWQASAAQKEQQWQAALQETIRKFYVALTRASRHNLLFFAPIALAEQCPGEWNSAPGYLLGHQSDQAGFLSQLQAMTHWQQRPCLSEPCSLTTQTLPGALDDIREIPARLYRPWWVSSYSSLPWQAKDHSAASQPQQASQGKEQELLHERPLPLGQVLSLHQFVRGAEAGNFFHSLLEYCAGHQGQEQQGFAAALADAPARQQYLQERLLLKGWQDWQPTLDHWLQQLLRQPMPSLGVSLAQLPGEQVLVEMEFWLASRQVPLAQLDQLTERWFLPGQARPKLKPQQLNGLLKGFIDLVFCHQGVYYILDWKSNHLGDDDASYDRPRLQQAMLDKRYDLQALLYLLALHRLLRQRLPDYQPKQHLGGALYWFLRGLDGPEHGLIHLACQAELIDELDQLFRHSDEVTP